jgi:hypothetical protein
MDGFRLLNVGLRATLVSVLKLWSRLIFVGRQWMGLEERITDEARNGLITAIGIVLGFALAFFGTWSMASGEWQRADIVRGLVLGLGIVILILPLYRSLAPYVQTVKRYEGTVKLFVSGITLLRSQ